MRSVERRERLQLSVSLSQVMKKRYIDESNAADQPINHMAGQVGPPSLHRRPLASAAARLTPSPPLLDLDPRCLWPTCRRWRRGWRRRTRSRCCRPWQRSAHCCRVVRAGPGATTLHPTSHPPVRAVENPPIEEVCAAGLVPRLVLLLHCHDYPNIQVIVMEPVGAPTAPPTPIPLLPPHTV